MEKYFVSSLISFKNLKNAFSFMLPVFSYAQRLAQVTKFPK